MVIKYVILVVSFSIRCLSQMCACYPSGDIVLELKAKKENLEKIVQEFENITPEPRDIVEWCLYRTALHACDLVASDHSYSPVYTNYLCSI